MQLSYTLETKKKMLVGITNSWKEEPTSSISQGNWGPISAKKLVKPSAIWLNYGSYSHSIELKLIN